ncbi:MAG TPA: YceI family protein [Acidimicrobiales bacterium]|nr:YceI family protein [Acidimicrobiales bacterium]
MATTTTPQAHTRNFVGLDIPASGTFAIDTSHSAAGFTVRHLVVAKTKGRFTDFSGTITIAEDPLESSVDVTIATGSISTGDDGRDTHLRSPDFFDVDQYPAMTYKSTAVRHASREHFVVEGELTIAGVTRPVALDVNYEGAVVDPWGGERAVFSASTKINREDFGLSWNQALETGGVLVGKDVSIDLEVEAVRQ